MKTLSKFLLIYIGFFCHSALSAEGGANLLVTRILFSENDVFGGCMVQFDEAPARQSGTACYSKWVSFSCGGNFNSPIEAGRMLDAIQLGWALNKKVRVYVRDTEKENNYCVATRVDLANDF